MKTLIVSLIIILFPSIGWAFDSWGKEDYAREIAWQAINLVDWNQTLSIADQPDKYKEYNPILGSHPDRGEVNLYFAAGALAHIAVIHVLPKKCRPYFQYLSIGFSGICVMNNFSIGLKVGF